MDVGKSRDPARRRKLVLGCLLFLPLGGLLVRESRRGWTAAKVERLIRAEILPGCDRRAVESWLDRHGFEHTWTTDAPFLEGCVERFAELAGRRPSELGGCLSGVITDAEANVGLFASGEVEMRFFFDAGGGSWPMPCGATS